MAAATDFSDVGFALDTANEAGFTKSVEALIGPCKLQALDAHNSLCAIKDASGAEIWIGLARDKSGGWEIQSVNPAFSGEGRTELEIVSDVSDPEYKTFEVTLSAHFAGDKAPLVFELADPRDAQRFAPGAKLSVDIAAFSLAPQIYADEAAYMKAQAKEKIAFTPNFFIPAGMFLQSMGGAMPDDSKRPVAQADFAGTVLKAELRTNTLGTKYWWTPVRTYDGAVVDVVMDPASIDQTPKPGAIVAGRFWLSARLAP